MSEEEIDILYNEILKLPKIERPITATTMCELNVKDLFDTIREFRKIPEYSDLLNENKRLKQELQQKENIIKELRSIIRRIKEKVKGVKEINNEVYKQVDMLERFYSRKWCNDEMDNLLGILGEEVN